MILLLGVWFLLGICLHGAVAKSHFLSVVEFGQGLITTKVLYLEQEVSLVRCRKLVDHIYLEKCIDNEEITNGILSGKSKNGNPEVQKFGSLVNRNFGISENWKIGGSEKR